MVVELSKRSSAEKFIDEINITNSKKVAVVFVFGFIAYHGILHLQYGELNSLYLTKTVRRLLRYNTNSIEKNELSHRSVLLSYLSYFIWYVSSNNGFSISY